MCGRFIITDPDEAMRELFAHNGPPLDMVPRYNVAPPLETFTVITVDAAPAIAHIHHRMPVMLTRREDLEAWLDATRSAEAALALLKPYAAADIAAGAVSLKVNNARYDGPDCVAP